MHPDEVIHTSSLAPWSWSLFKPLSSIPNYSLNIINILHNHRKNAQGLGQYQHSSMVLGNPSNFHTYRHSTYDTTTSRPTTTLVTAKSWPISMCTPRCFYSNKGTPIELTGWNSLRIIYHDKGLKIPDDFNSTRTVPPTHFLEYANPSLAGAIYTVRAARLMILQSNRTRWCLVGRIEAGSGAAGLGCWYIGFPYVNYLVHNCHHYIWM